MAAETDEKVFLRKVNKYKPPCHPLNLFGYSVEVSYLPIVDLVERPVCQIFQIVIKNNQKKRKRIINDLFFFLQPTPSVVHFIYVIYSG